MDIQSGRTLHDFDFEKILATILTAGKNICAFGGACAASGCCAEGIKPCPAGGAIGAPTAGVVIVVRSVVPLRPDRLAGPVADWRS